MTNRWELHDTHDWGKHGKPGEYTYTQYNWGTCKRCGISYSYDKGGDGWPPGEKKYYDAKGMDYIQLRECPNSSAKTVCWEVAQDLDRLIASSDAYEMGSNVEASLIKLRSKLYKAGKIDE